jgi:hypothetical protein
METREWRFTDKSEWGPGEWQNEPDKMQWQDEETGLPCLIVRGPAGALCGYVGVARGHPWFGVDYSACAQKPTCGEDYCDHGPGSTVRVHGGLTYSDKCTESEHGICHVVQSGEDDHVWWFGFDCAHYQDFAPKYHSLPQYRMFDEHTIYRNLSYVKTQIQRLARQIAAVK